MANINDVLRRVSVTYETSLEAEKDLCPIDGAPLVDHPTDGTRYCPNFRFHIGS